MFQFQLTDAMSISHSKSKTQNAQLTMFLEFSKKPFPPPFGRRRHLAIHAARSAVQRMALSSIGSVDRSLETDRQVIRSSTWTCLDCDSVLSGTVFVRGEQIDRIHIYFEPCQSSTHAFSFVDKHRYTIERERERERERK